MKEHIDRYNRLVSGANNQELIGIMDAALGDAMQADNSEEGSPMCMALTALHLCLIEMEERASK